ncbi:MAG TPA: 16S rRNA (guanine(966)-N(2))-methyltransferase RsmD [Verrucomicrobiae bacterium]|nr:16S rRNA (guanine(966)-N(2))-methyltransferase RsmD [Verrucomicrobiae bacterium]
MIATGKAEPYRTSGGEAAFLMRIIAGKFRGRRLKSPPSLETRPTSDRLRETLFNILAPRLGGACFLDLCAGSGAIGIEALSRGASHVTFVDRSRKMYALIETNLKLLEVEGDTVEVASKEALDFLRRRIKSDDAPFDVIFFDPPYTMDYEEVLGYVGAHAERLLAEDGVVIVEHHKKKKLAEEFGHLKRYRVLKQGDSELSFYARQAA